MSPVALSTLLALAAATSCVLAQDPTTSSVVPLASKHFNFDNLPYQADPDNGVRGTQTGYNRCNSTTEGPDSLCQTDIVNGIDDFCLWGPIKPGSTIADTEGEEVAWCTKKGHGSRLIPAGAITGVQVLNAPDYVQVIAFLDQTKINIVGDDPGGELDSHGADLRGNPLGGLVYTTAFSGDNTTYQQVIEWHNFVGSNSSCFKICKPSSPQAPQLCQHIYDRIGVMYNCAATPTDGTFEVCDSENQDPPGIYTSNGQVMTYTQPPESLGPITSMPYQPRIPASSNCRQFASSALFTDLVGPTSTSTSTSAPGSAPTGGSTASRSGSSSSGGPSPTGGAGQGGNGAGALGVSVLSTMAGVVAAVAFLA